jgi:hypothetical protein
MQTYHVTLEVTATKARYVYSVTATDTANAIAQIDITSGKSTIIDAIGC